MEKKTAYIWGRIGLSWQNKSAEADLFCNQVQFVSESARRASAEVISETCITSPGEREREKIKRRNMNLSQHHSFLMLLLESH